MSHESVSGHDPDEAADSGPPDPLADKSGLLVDLLEALTDEELEQYMVRLNWMFHQTVPNPTNSPYRSPGFRRWKISNLMAAVHRERKARSLEGPSS